MTVVYIYILLDIENNTYLKITSIINKSYKQNSKEPKGNFKMY